MTAAVAAAEPAPALIMVAPNGARRSRADHPATPLTVAEIADTAAACHAAGAGAIHLHVRDKDGSHVLDAGLYAEATAAIEAATGGAMAVQITTESAGRYAPEHQVAIVGQVRPRAVSVALGEIALASGFERQATRFYADCAASGIGVQHILYSAQEVRDLARLIEAGLIPAEPPALLVVHGRRDADVSFSAARAFVAALVQTGLADRAAWMACAFGRSETRVLAATLGLGGHARVGFENNLLGPDGGTAPDNAARVRAIADIAARIGRPVTARDALAFLGLPRAPAATPARPADPAA